MLVESPADYMTLVIILPLNTTENALTWLPVELHIKVTLRAVFYPHPDQSPGDLKYKQSTKQEC